MRVSLTVQEQSALLADGSDSLIFPRIIKKLQINIAQSWGS